MTVVRGHLPLHCHKQCFESGIKSWCTCITTAVGVTSCLLPACTSKFTSQTAQSSTMLRTISALITSLKQRAATAPIHLFISFCSV